MRVNLVEYLRYLLVAALTVVLVSRFQHSSEWVDLILKGSLSFFVYVALLWLIDPGIRMRVGLFFRHTTGASANAAGQADPI